MSLEFLFNKYDVHGFVQGRLEAVKKRVQSIPPNSLLNASEHDLVQAIVEEFRFDVPIIKDGDIYIEHSGETQVDVSDDPMRGLFDRSRPFYVPGSLTVIAVPFEGDPEYLNIRPQIHTHLPQQTELGVP